MFGPLSRRGVCVLLSLGIAGAVPLAAQSQPRLPACDPAAMEYEPCASAYDTPPVLVSEADLVSTGDEARVTLVWMLVDTTGAVLTSQVGRSAGMDWDFAAVERAKGFRFHPAMHAGRPTPAWMLLPVAASPPVATCATLPMSVPLSAGGEFVDSTVFEDPALGTAFHYRTRGGWGMDMFAYPAPEGGSPEQQVEETIVSLRSGEVRYGPDSLAVLGRGAERVRLYESGGGGVVTGRSARMRLWFGGEAAESYVAVFPSRGEFVKFRATYPATREARETVGEFLRSMLSSRGWRDRGCPR